MINYKNIIKKAKIELSDSIKFTNTSNKDYKNNLLKLTNLKQMSILLKGLNILNKNLNNFISK